MNFLDELNSFAAIVYSRRNRSVKRIKRIPGDIRGDNERHFRLSEENKRTLVEEFHAWRGCGHTASSEKRVEVFLSFLAGGGFYRQIGHAFALAKTTIIKYTHEVADFIFSSAQDHIGLPQSFNSHIYILRRGVYSGVNSRSLLWC